MAKKMISINFCGGCNPVINRSQIALELRNILAINNYSISYNRLDADIVIFISGCTVNCAQRNKTTTASYIIVAGATVDLISVKESKIVPEILSKIPELSGVKQLFLEKKCSKERSV